MSNTIKPINYKEYPECMFAMISSFLSPEEGDDLRRVSGEVSFRHIDENGRTYKNGLLHSFTDEPAIVEAGGTYKVWYKEGLVHRDGDKPALVDDNLQVWYQHGRRHREGDMPAVIDGEYNAWYIDDEIHRDGHKPAVINGRYRAWYVNGECQRRQQ